MHQHKRDMTTFPPTVRAAKQAFAMAGLTPSDVDVAEVHDFFTGIEHLGFADRFEGYKLLEAGVTSVGGALPVNPSGGLKAKGHPPGGDRCGPVCRVVRAVARHRRQSGRRGPNRIGALGEVID
jgi:acetyl-CoA acetyltransferase